MTNSLDILRRDIASGAISPRQAEKVIADAEKERREYVRHMPERILKAFTYAIDEKGQEIEDGHSNIKFRLNPETGEIVIHTSNRHAHALLHAQALRREHDAGLLKFDVGAQKDPGTKDGWHYRIAIKGDAK